MKIHGMAVPLLKPKDFDMERWRLECVMFTHTLRRGGVDFVESPDRSGVWASYSKDGEHDGFFVYIKVAT